MNRRIAWGALFALILIGIGCASARVGPGGAGVRVQPATIQVGP